MNRPLRSPERRHRLLWWLILLLVTALITASGIPFASVRGWLDQQAGDGSADPYTPSLHLRLVWMLRAGSLGLLLLYGGITRLPKRWQQRWRRECERTRRILAALTHSPLWDWRLLVVVGVAAGLRTILLQQPMRFDEAYTYLNYASQPLYITVTRYDTPNNHIAHSVLVHVVMLLLGHSPPAIRFTACVGGVLTAALACIVARRWAGPTAGLIAGLLVATSSPLIEYSVNARGYTWTHVATLGLLLLTDFWCLRPRWRQAYGLSLLMALALWTIPTAIYPVIMIVFQWLIMTVCDASRARRWWRCRQLAVALVAGGLLTGLLYSPVVLVNGGGAFLSTGGGSLPWMQWWSGLQSELIHTLRLLLRDQPLLSLLFMGSGLLAGFVLCRDLCRQTLLFCGGFLLCVALVTCQRVIPPARTWLFVIPWLTCILAGGMTTLIACRLQGGQRQFAACLILLVCGLGPVISQWRHDSIRQSAETGFFPEASAIIHDLHDVLSPDEPLIAVSPASAPLAYAALRAGWDLRHFDRPGSGQLRSDRGFLVTCRRPAQTVDAVLRELQLPTEGRRITEYRTYATAIVYRLDPAP